MSSMRTVPPRAISNESSVGRQPIRGNLGVVGLLVPGGQATTSGWGAASVVNKCRDTGCKGEGDDVGYVGQAVDALYLQAAAHAHAPKAPSDSRAAPGRPPTRGRCPSRRGGDRVAAGRSGMEVI